MPKANEEIILYRGIHKPSESVRKADFDKLYKPGNVFSNRAFLSTSSSEKVASVFATSNVKAGTSVEVSESVLFSIKSKSARNIENYAVLKDEKEWLFPSGSVFKVETVGKKTIPTLQVDAKGNIIREKNELTFIQLSDLDPANLSSEERDIDSTPI
jgi:hypothetical protein